MRIAEIHFFAPNHRFATLNLEDSTNMIEAFKARVEGFYLSPARKLIDTDDAFAGGVICTANDWVIVIVGKNHAMATNGSMRRLLEDKKLVCRVAFL